VAQSPGSPTIEGRRGRSLTAVELSIGAGGAITWLSDRDGEWEEVLTKVRSVVGMLAGVH
jgi:anthranilate/para-aminobenzoate synthase component I